MIARSYVRDAMVAEDIVADCFLSFWEKRESLDENSNIEVYILRSVKNRCLNWLRDEKTRQKVREDIHSSEQQLLDANIQSLENTVPKVILAWDVKNIIDECVESLPALSRQVFESSRYANNTYAEIAAELGIPIRRVEYELKKTLDILRNKLAGYI